MIPTLFWRDYAVNRKVAFNIKMDLFESNIDLRYLSLIIKAKIYE